MHPIKKELDKVSSCFCTAKWLQVTVRLQNGQTHSCHHPKTHKIPVESLKTNPSALHNTDVKKEARRMMLEGNRPSECSYCWKVEDLPDNQVSDRFIKSSDEWAKPYLDEVSKLPWDANVNPKYLEVSFSNICNFKCAYCFPDVSSKWMSEILKYGPYPTTDYFGSLVYVEKEGQMPLPEKDNPYVEAFWRWLPDIISDLKVLRVTGGEPLLSKDCKKLLDFLENNPSPDLDLSINSNLGVPTPLVKEVLQRLRSLKESGKIKKATIFTSIDTWGDQAAYVRFGLNLDLWKKNLELCLNESAYLKTTIMVTFNALSVFHFKNFLEFALEKRRTHNGQPFVDVSILHNPEFLSLQILSPRHRQLIKDSLDYMIENSEENNKRGFYGHELSKMKRLWEFSKVELPSELLHKNRVNFAAYFNEYDKRKKTSFIDTFPEMKDDFLEWLKVLKSRPLFTKIQDKLLLRSQKSIGNKLYRG